MKQRLKLYDDTLYINVGKKLKKQTKKIAFDNSLTVSAYVRKIIERENLKYTNKKLKKDIEENSTKMQKLGGI